MCDHFGNFKVLFLSTGLLFASVLVAHAQSPVGFVENKNQWPEDIDFVSRIPGGRMSIAAGGFRYVFIDAAKLQALHHGAHEPDGYSASDSPVRGHAVHVDHRQREQLVAALEAEVG